MSPLKIIISGGGTGGHIYPAIAIADAIKELRPDTQFLFVGAKGKMEMKKVPDAGYKIEGLWISGIKRSLSLSNLSFPFKLIHSSIRAKKIIKEFQPDVAVGTGGYAAGPILRAAGKAGIPTLLQEQNALPGITNRLLGQKAKRVCVAYPGLEKYFDKNKILLTGNPVRKKVIDIEGKREKALQHFGQNPNLKTVLIVGGSLGSLNINNALIQNIENIKNQADKFQLIWQTGERTYAQVEEALKKHKPQNIKAVKFINEMDLGYAAADLVISRAGAIAVSEISLVQKPVILVPFPFAAENHQKLNAEALQKRKAAEMIEDKDLNEKLFPEIQRLLQDDDLRAVMSRNIADMAVYDSAEIIANEVLKLTEK